MIAPEAGFQSPLADGIARFLAHKRALGRRYDTEEKQLRLLDRFLVRHALTSLEQLTPDLLNSFLAARPRRRPRSYNELLGVLRRLLDWLVSREILPQSPLETLPRRETAQRIPYLFDAAHARRLLELAGDLPDGPQARFRGPTYRTIFALLYSLGLRVGEVSRLRCADVDLERNLLVVRGTKFGKSRLVPFGPRLAALLRDYLELRGGASCAPEAPVFSFTRRGAVSPGIISQTFHQLVPRLGLVVPAGVAPPRAHDLRHAFAVGTLLRWYRAGIDPAGRFVSLGDLPRARPSQLNRGLSDDHARAAPRGQSPLRAPGGAGARRGVVMTPPALGPLVQSFFADGLLTMKGLRPASLRSYRDVLRLFLRFVAQDTGRKITRLALADLSFECVLRFVRYLEDERHNQIRTRNQRVACLHTFFDYLAGRVPELLEVAERVAAIPMKRVPPPETRFLERDEVQALLAALPVQGVHALRDRALLLFLYNTGARVQEVADLRVGDLELAPPARVRLHGKGDKWRTCPLWADTARQLGDVLDQRGTRTPDTPVFASRRGRPLTRFGIYKLVRRHTRRLETAATQRRRISPRVFRHTTAVHLLEAGVEINVIRGWLGHVSLDTTNRYAEITTRAKEAALRVCEPPTAASAALPATPVWRTDESLLAWLNSL